MLCYLCRILLVFHSRSFSHAPHFFSFARLISPFWTIQYRGKKYHGSLMMVIQTKEKDVLPAYCHIGFLLLGNKNCSLHFCADQFKTSTPSTPSPGIHGAFNYFPCPGSREFDTKDHPVGGEFDICLGRVGNLNRKSQV